MATESLIFQQIVDMTWSQAIYTASPNDTINVVQFSAKGSGTNIGIALTPKGAGYISAQVPDGTATGGNARGQRAVDLQLSRVAAAAVASGVGSAIFGGNGCTASGAGSSVVGSDRSVSSGSKSIILGGEWSAATGENSAALGGYSVASGTHSAVLGGFVSDASGSYSSVIGGYGANARRYGQVAHASGIFGVRGDCQSFIHELRSKTTNNTETELFIDGASVRLVLTANYVISAIVEITGLKSDGSASASYHRQVEIKRIGNTTTLVKNEVIGVDNASGTSIAITADDTNESLKIAVTGIAAETWRWMATVRGSEMGMGT